MGEKIDLPPEILAKILKSVKFVTNCKFCKTKISGRTEAEAEVNYQKHMDECKVLELVKAIGIRDLRKLARSWKKPTRSRI